MDQENTLVDRIEADSIIVEVIDKHTGKMYRRAIPVTYLETDNGIVLVGEDLDGNPSHINLLSTAALAKINDLIGKGPDHSRCNSEEETGHVR